MSLIEQAAKRLELLRRAGADLPEGSEPEPATEASGETPTPEAVVRALEARAPQQQPPVERHEDPGRRRETPRQEPPDTSHPSKPRVEIDLARLAARGFLTPNSPKSQLA